MILDSEQVARLYRRLAPLYDLMVVPLEWLGARRHRERAVHSLQLRPGGVVLDLGCGTGLNMPLLHDAVGASGRIVCVDLSAEMLSRARRRAERYGFTNVEWVQVDLATYRPPPGCDGALATFALEMVPEYDEVVGRVSAALAVRGRVAVYGLKHPERWPSWLVQLGVWITAPFGVSRAYEALRPYKAVREHLSDVEYREFLLGAAYLCVGERAGTAASAGDADPTR